MATEVFFCQSIAEAVKGQNFAKITYPLPRWNIEENGVKTMVEILKDYDIARAESIKMLLQFDEEFLTKTQIMRKNPYTPVGIGYIVAGHCLHHLNMIEKNYLD